MAQVKTRRFTFRRPTGRARRKRSLISESTSANKQAAAAKTTCRWARSWLAATTRGAADPRSSPVAGMGAWAGLVDRSPPVELAAAGGSEPAPMRGTLRGSSGVPQPVVKTRSASIHARSPSAPCAGRADVRGARRRAAMGSRASLLRRRSWCRPRLAPRVGARWSWGWPSRRRRWPPNCSGCRPTCGPSSARPAGHRGLRPRRLVPGPVRGHGRGRGSMC